MITPQQIKNKEQKSVSFSLSEDFDSNIRILPHKKSFNEDEILKKFKELGMLPVLAMNQDSLTKFCICYSKIGVRCLVSFDFDVALTSVESVEIFVQNECNVYPHILEKYREAIKTCYTGMTLATRGGIYVQEKCDQKGLTYNFKDYENIFQFSETSLHTDPAFYFSELTSLESSNSVRSYLSREKPLLFELFSKSGLIDHFNSKNIVHVFSPPDRFVQRMLKSKKYKIYAQSLICFNNSETTCTQNKVSEINILSEKNLDGGKLFEIDTYINPVSDKINISSQVFSEDYVTLLDANKTKSLLRSIEQKLYIDKISKCFNIVGELKSEIQKDFDLFRKEVSDYWGKIENLSNQVAKTFDESLISQIEDENIRAEKLFGERSNLNKRYLDLFLCSFTKHKLSN